MFNFIIKGKEKDKKTTKNSIKELKLLMKSRIGNGNRLHFVILVSENHIVFWFREFS